MRAPLSSRFFGPTAFASARNPWADGDVLVGQSPSRRGFPPAPRSAVVSHSPYSKQPARLVVTAEDRGVLNVRAGGFLTHPMIDDALRPFGLDAAVSGAMPRFVLIDVRDLAGYDRSCGPIARELLSRAHATGVRKIAFVASSAVLRTAARVLAGSATVALRAFEHPTSARRWLDHADHGENEPSSPRVVAPQDRV